MRTSSECIAIQRVLLDRLERFVPTEQYRRLLAVVADADADLPEAWLAEWLIQPAFGLDDLPIDVASQAGGVDLLEAHLARILRNAGA